MVGRLGSALAVCLLATCFAGCAVAQSGDSTSDSSALHGPSFVPDSKFAGSALTGWHTLGQADWRAENGELVGKATGKGGGWLVLDHSLQDTGFYTAFRCTGSCDTGILLRMTKTADGWTGTYLSIKGSELRAENLTLNTNGDVVEREKLRNAAGQVRYAPPEPDPTALPAAALRAPSFEAAPGVTLPAKRPLPIMRNGEWNEVETVLDANILRAYLNDTDSQISVATAGDDMDSYGPVALYVGKDSEVRFKDASYKDLAIKVQPLEQVGDRFRMQRLSPFYYNWTAAAADFTHSGKLDLVSGAYLYLAPDYTKFREIYPARSFNPSTEYSTWDQHAYDFTGDGWPDVIGTYLGVGAILYVNPGGESRRWKQYRVLPSMQSEYSLLKDIDGDGKPELIYMADGYVRYAKPDPANPTRPWVVHTISERGTGSAHGIGVGDINGDGRLDIVTAYGWWEQPPPGSGDQLWKYHPQAFGRWGRVSYGGAEIGIYDINGDGLNDVVTSLDAHGFGLAWYEQKRSASGEISFVEHMVMDNYNTQNSGGVTFAELHGTAIADVDGDGIPDFIVGKRQFSHKDDYLDPDVYGPPYLYWYKTVRDPKAPGGARLVPELIHNSSGAGDHLLAIDLNGDGVMDIVAPTKRGLYIFWGKPTSKQK
jgi:hypothetical protein